MLYLYSPLIRLAGTLAVLLVATSCATKHHPTTMKEPLRLHARWQEQSAASAQTEVRRELHWVPEKTALIVCDMWDDHWCRGAARRVTELAEPMNAVLKAARERGVFVIHAPSSTVNFYRDTPQRRLAQQAPFHRPPATLATSERWGTAWCWPDAQREPTLPIDDSDMGCDCAIPCPIREAWTRQIATLEIKEGDAITDNGQETFNLLAERGIENVVLLGVHLNMCVLGRPFGIRQMVHLGKNVVFMRDMTDTMYNSRMKPHVNHFAGTDLVAGHIERYWCPSITSVDFVGGKPFRFQEDKR